MKKVLLDQLKYVIFINLWDFVVSTLLILEVHESIKFKGVLSQYLTSFVLILFNSFLKKTLKCFNKLPELE